MAKLLGKGKTMIFSKNSSYFNGVGVLLIFWLLISAYVFLIDVVPVSDQGNLSSNGTRIISLAENAMINPGKTIKVEITVKTVLKSLNITIDNGITAVSLYENVRNNTKIRISWKAKYFDEKISILFSSNGYFEASYYVKVTGVSQNLLVGIGFIMFLITLNTGYKYFTSRKRNKTINSLEKEEIKIKRILKKRTGFGEFYVLLKKEYTALNWKGLGLFLVFFDFLFITISYLTGNNYLYSRLFSPFRKIDGYDPQVFVGYVNKGDHFEKEFVYSFSKELYLLLFGYSKAFFKETGILASIYSFVLIGLYLLLLLYPVFSNEAKKASLHEKSYPISKYKLLISRLVVLSFAVFTVMIMDFVISIINTVLFSTVSISIEAVILSVVMGFLLLFLVITFYYLVLEILRVNYLRYAFFGLFLFVLLVFPSVIFTIPLLSFVFGDMLKSMNGDETNTYYSAIQILQKWAYYETLLLIFMAGYSFICSSYFRFFLNKLKMKNKKEVMG